MDGFSKILLGMYALIILIILGIIIFLAVRRIEIKKKEDFEKRDN